MRRFALLLTASLACLALCGLLSGAARAEGRVRAAFVLLGGVNDQGWNQAHYEGIREMRARLGEAVEIDLAENVSRERAGGVLRDFARRGFHLVFATSLEHMQAVYDVAGEFPDVKFMHCSGYKTRPNLGTYMLRIEQAEYLAGYAAGLLGFRRVGTVATLPEPEVVRGINAFTLGLARGLKESRTAHDPERINAVTWLLSWRDPERETSLALDQVAWGRDLVRQMADTPESARAACAKDVPAVGYCLDAARQGAACALTSTLCRWGTVYEAQVRAVLEGTWTPAQILAGFPERAVDLAPFGTWAPKAVRDKVLAEKALMEQGQDRSFAGPVLDQSGLVRIPAGQKPTDQELLAMRWFVQGVEGGLPK